MSYELLIMILFFVICILIGILLIFFCKNENEEDLERQLIQFSKRYKEMKEELSLGNKEINRIEKEILNCKKKLGIKLFK